MSKFCGIVGFFTTVETEPGLWENKNIEKKYYGDITRNFVKYQMNSQINNDIQINNNVSIIMDPFASENFQHIQFIKYLGFKWKVTNAEVQYPRLILTLGGRYNESN